MAIKLSEYEKATYKARGKLIEIENLYISKAEDSIKGKKYLARFKYDNKTYTKILGYSNKDKLTTKKASNLLHNYKDEIENGIRINNNTTLNASFDSHIDTLPNTKWTKEKIGVYDRYIKEPLGKKKIIDIKPSHIKKIIASLDKKGYKKTTQKKVLSVLKPLFKALIQDKSIREDPTQYITVKLDSTKKPVTNATILYKRIYNAILEYYQDNPFYQALFLFVMYGRRKDEILSLKWYNIDLNNNYYWIEDTKNGDKQQYPLPMDIKIQLLDIKDTKSGLVFKSPVTGGKLTDVKRQTNQIRKYLDMPEFHFHYMRNVVVSMLAENEINATTLSGILGHKDVNTINKYVSLNHFNSGQIANDKISEILDVEVLE
jgi:integrase